MKPKQLGDLKKQVAVAHHILFDQGLADYHGHVSARIPGTRKILIKPVLKQLDKITSRDIMIVDIDEYKERCEENFAKTGKQKSAIELKAPPRETILHTAIYEARPDVNSVIHTHQQIATAFASAGVPILPLYNQAAPFAPETPIYPSPRLIYKAQDGVEIADALRDRTALLLQGHGVVVVGESVEHATSNTVYLERAAEMQWIASTIGKPILMPQKDIDMMRDNMTRRSYHAFEFFASLLKKRKV